jgi:2-dehydropantoate 2-reductase
VRIAVIGAGGVGGYFGGRLSAAGEQVIFVARGEHLRAMRAHGLHVQSIEGDFTVQPVTAVETPAEVGPVDFVIVAIKTGQIRETAPSLLPLVGPETTVVPLQNGVEAPFELATLLGSKHVVGGLCFIGSTIAAPGRIRHFAAKPRISIGELHDGPSQRLDRLQQAFARAGVDAEVVRNIRAAMWEKFLFITAYAGIGAVTRAPAGVLHTLPHARALLKRSMEEVVAVASACGVALSPDVIPRTLAHFAELPPNATAAMQRDIMNGRPSELDALNGAVVRIGQSAGVSTPLHSFITQCLEPQELRARGQLDVPW